MLMARSVSVVLFAALAASTTAGLASAPTSEALRACVAGEATNADFSGVVTISTPGGSFSYARGLMAGPDSAAITPAAQFNLGSAGKMFTAVAVAQLVDANKVRLDDPIAAYVDGLSTEAGVVTIRQLLTHSGGLGNFFSPENLARLQAAKSLSDLKPLITDEKPMFPPGSRFQYSNSGFLLLGLMIERVSGETYADYLARRIFAPSGMTASSLAPAPPVQRAIGLTNLPELLMPPPGGGLPPGGGPPPGPPQGPPPGPPPGAPGGPGAMLMPPPGPLRPAAEAALIGNSAGGSYSTGQDMDRFFAAFLAGQLTSPAMRDMLMSQQIEVAPARDGKAAIVHGLGFGVGTHQGHRWTGHNGGTLGVNVEMMTFPDDQTTIVIMANRDPPMAMALMQKVRSFLFGGAAC